MFKPNDLSSCDQIDGIIEDASKDLDRLIDEIFRLDFEEQGFHSHPHPTFDNEDIFEHVLVEPLPQLDMKPYFFEEKRKPEKNHLPLKKRLVWKGGSATTRTNHATSTPECATHDFVCATPTSDFEEPSSKCITSDSPSKEVISNSKFGDFSAEVNQGMDKKVSSAVLPSIERRCKIKYSQNYSPETFLHSRTTPKPTSSKKFIHHIEKVQIHDDIPPSSESNSAHDDIPPSSEFKIIPFASPTSAQKDAHLSIRPTNSENSSHVEPETYSKKVRPHELATPKKVIFKEFNAHEVIRIHHLGS